MKESMKVENSPILDSMMKAIATGDIHSSTVKVVSGNAMITISMKPMTPAERHHYERNRDRY